MLACPGDMTTLPNFALVHAVQKNVLPDGQDDALIGLVCCNIVARPHDAVAPLSHDHVLRVQASKLCHG